MSARTLLGWVVFATAAMLLSPAPVTAAPVAAPTVITLGTIAPVKSPWYRVLEEIRQDWQRLSGGRVVVRIVRPAGDEKTLVQKMGVRLLDAVAVSGVGMVELDKGVSALHLPLLFRSYAELDHVRDRLAPRLEQRIARRNCVVISWSDVGWIYFFSKKPFRTPAELRQMRLYTTAGDAEAESLLKAAGFKPQPLPSTELLTGLTSNMIDAFDVPPLFASLNQSVGLAPYMLDLRWAALTGAIIVDARAWDQVPEPLRGPLLEAGRAAAVRARDRIRKLGDETVVELQRQGTVKIVTLDDATRRMWEQETASVYPKLRDTMVPADLFDEVQRLVAEYRQQPASR